MTLGLVPLSFLDPPVSLDVPPFQKTESLIIVPEQMLSVCERRQGGAITYNLDEYLWVIKPPVYAVGNTLAR